MATSRELQLESILDFVRGLGKQHGRGPIGRFVLATFLCARAHDDDRILQPDDAPAVMQAMKEGSGNDSPDIANDLRPFIVLGQRDDIDGQEQLAIALQRLIALKKKGKVESSLSWACLCAFAHAQSSAKRELGISAIDLLFTRSN